MRTPGNDPELAVGFERADTFFDARSAPERRVVLRLVRGHLVPGVEPHAEDADVAEELGVGEPVADGVRSAHRQTRDEHLVALGGQLAVAGTNNLALNGAISGTGNVSVTGGTLTFNGTAANSLALALRCAKITASPRTPSRCSKPSKGGSRMNIGRITSLLLGIGLLVVLGLEGETVVTETTLEVRTNLMSVLAEKPWALGYACGATRVTVTP